MEINEFWLIVIKLISKHINIEHIIGNNNAYFNDKLICKNEKNLYQFFYKDVIKSLISKKISNSNSAILAKPSIKLMNSMYSSIKKNKAIKVSKY